MDATIAPGPDLDPALSQEALFRLGMEHVRRLARWIWTDHNAHDPGITTLELLAYALSDLSYRASMPVEDLVSSAENNQDNLAMQFHTARKILPVGPLTIHDYRRLVIDQPGVQNAWLLPDELTFYADTVKAKLLCNDPELPGVRKVSVRGLYKVMLEYAPDVRTQARRSEVETAVRQVLNSNRSLCLEFTEITAVARQEFLLCGEIELAPGADTALATGHILAAVQNYLAPPVMSYSLDEMCAKKLRDGTLKYAAPEVFEGPRLQHGFIDTDELEAAELRTEVRLSDVIGLVMDVEGVVAVRDMVISPQGADELVSRWVQPVQAGKQPVLDVTGSRLVFYKGIMPVVPDSQKVAEHTGAITERLKSRLEGPGLKDEDLLVPAGRFRDPGSYQSMQNHFPAVYGVGPYGVSSHDGRALALSRQLKAYLLFFDQVMANYCAQLASVRRLLSWEPGLEHSRFSQLVDTLSGYEEIYVEGNPDGKLATLMETAEQRAAARSRLLDHLIGRFAERFHDYAELMRSAFGAGPGSIESTKCEFLDRYPSTGYERATGEDYTRTDASSGWDSENVSGLERRLASLLGLPRATRRNLGSITLGPDTEIYEKPPGKFSFRLRNGAGEASLLYTSAKFDSPEEASAALVKALEAAQDYGNYDRKSTSGGKLYFNVVDGGSIVALNPGRYDTEAKRDDAIEDLVGYLRRNYGREGMYLIENLHLRPMGACEDSLLLPICIDPSCTDCSDDDPYSYRIHIVLPAEAGRFRNMSFRAFAEELIRSETPAHILPKICWIGDEDMVELQRAYRLWIDVRSNPAHGSYGSRLRKLIEVLYRVKNIYPQARLTECGPEEQTMFVLDATSLGTLPEDE